MELIIDKYITLFFFYSLCGWIWETIYCTFKEKHFQSRGFLFGPICPIYGVAIITGQIIYECTDFFDPGNISAVEIFLISFFGSAALEYFTSLYLEKRFHIRWWDYSTMPLNINGRVCLPASLFFGMLGTVVVIYVLPALSNMPSEAVPSLTWNIAALILVSIASADFALTEASLSSITQHLTEMESSFTERAEKAYQTMINMPANTRVKLSISKTELSNIIKQHKPKMNWRHRNILWKIKELNYPAEKYNNKKKEECKNESV